MLCLILGLMLVLGVRFSVRVSDLVSVNSNSVMVGLVLIRFSVRLWLKSNFSV